MLGNAQHKTQWNESIGTLVSSGTRDKRNAEMGALKSDEPSLCEQHRDKSENNCAVLAGEWLIPRKTEVDQTRQPWLCGRERVQQIYRAINRGRAYGKTPGKGFRGGPGKLGKT